MLSFADLKYDVLFVYQNSVNTSVSLVFNTSNRMPTDKPVWENELSP